MRIKIGMYEVEIKAKAEPNTKFNRIDTMTFLHLLSIVFYESADRYYELGIDIRGLEGKGKERMQISTNIDLYLDKEGFYN